MIISFWSVVVFKSEDDIFITILIEVVLIHFFQRKEFRFLYLIDDLSNIFKLNHLPIVILNDPLFCYDDVLRSGNIGSLIKNPFFYFFII